MSRVCGGETRCPVLTRCVVTEKQYDSELAQDATAPACEAIARQVTTRTRAQYIVDSGIYGPHFQDHLIYRTAPNAQQVLVAELPPSTQLKLTLTPNTYPNVPAGYDKFVGDVVVLDTSCTEGTTPVDIAFLVDPHMPLEEQARLRAAVRGDGMFSFLDFVDSEHDFTVTVNVDSFAPVELVYLVDTDECAQDACGDFATCTNTLGSFKCTCNEGYDDVAGVCTPQTFECPPMSVRVSNGAELDFGWRVREMRLYTDEHCSTEVVQPGAAVLYAANSNKECSGTEVSVSSHPREIIRSNQCYVKCGAGATFAQRRLSIKRRMQVSGADWSNCDGY
jgi:hypothetical protein